MKKEIMIKRNGDRNGRYCLLSPAELCGCKRFPSHLQKRHLREKHIQEPKQRCLAQEELDASYSHSNLENIP